MMEQYDADSGKGIPIISNYLNRPTSIADESLLLAGLVKPINIKRIYVNRECSEKAKQIVKDWLDSESDE